MGLRSLSALLVLVSACGGGPPSTAESTRAQTPALTATATAVASPLPTAMSNLVPVALLRKGGLYIVHRHGVANVGVEAPLILLADCSTQANLNDAARRDLAQMGSDIAALGIPIGTVLSSPYCRTLETARIVFKKEPVREDALLRGAYAPVAGQPTPAASAERLEAVKRMLTVVPAAGTNVVLVTHGDVIRAVLGLDVEMGEAVVVQPDGRGAFAPIARVLPLAWKAP